MNVHLLHLPPGRALGWHIPGCELRNTWVLQATLDGGLATQEAALAAALGGTEKYKAHSLENQKGSLPAFLAQERAWLEPDNSSICVWVEYPYWYW